MIGGRGGAGPSRRGIAISGGIAITGMLVVVTVKAQQFPVAAVGRIIVVVVVFMMDREFTHRAGVKLAAAPPTSPRAGNC